MLGPTGEKRSRVVTCEWIPGEAILGCDWDRSCPVHGEEPPDPAEGEGEMSTRVFTREELDAMHLPDCWRPAWNYERREGEATALHLEWHEEKRWSTVWRLIFKAPDDGKIYEIFYREGSTENQEDSDPWNDEDRVTATEVEARPVVRSEWRPVRRGLVQLGNALVDAECVRPFPPAQGIADEVAHGCWEPNFVWLREKAKELRLLHAGIFAPDTGLPEMLVTYLDRAEAAAKRGKEKLA
jgi:hypothetical protein